MMISKKLKKKFQLSPMAIVFLGFIVVMLVGAFLLALPISNTSGKWLTFTHAVFWAMNGVCGTGLVVSSTALSFTMFGQVILLLLIQFGGLGFMTIATLVFIIIRKRITLKDRIAIQVALGQDRIKGVVRLVRNIIIMTAVVELTGTVLLIPFFCVRNGAFGVWQAFFNSISAFCNAGFDVMGTQQNPYGSLSDYNGNVGILLIIGIIAIIGALGFTVINDMLKCKFRFRRFTFHTKAVIVMSVSLMTFGTLFMLASEFNSAACAGMSGGEKLLNCFFQSVTASTTAGFSSLNQADLSPTGKIFTCFLMFVGASPCSTGGGIKTTTFAVLILMMVSGIRGKDNIQIGKRCIGYKTGLRAVAVIMLAGMLIIVGGSIVMATDAALPATEIFFDTISAFTDVGLSMNTCPRLSNGGLYVFAVIMFIGRLGPLSVGMIFAKQDNYSGLKFPPANIMIG